MAACYAVSVWLRRTAPAAESEGWARGMLRPLIRDLVLLIVLVATSTASCPACIQLLARARAVWLGIVLSLGVLAGLRRLHRADFGTWREIVVGAAGTAVLLPALASVAAMTILFTMGVLGPWLLHGACAECLVDEAAAVHYSNPLDDPRFNARNMPIDFSHGVTDPEEVPVVQRWMGDLVWDAGGGIVLIWLMTVSNPSSGSYPQVSSCTMRCDHVQRFIAERFR